MKKIVDILVITGFLALFMAIILAGISILTLGFLAQMGVRWNITL